jgi:hypothetical protein
VPSLTDTCPVGVPLPGELALTLTSTVKGWPTTGVTVVLVMSVVVASSPTVTGVALEVFEEASFRSPL